MQIRLTMDLDGEVIETWVLKDDNDDWNLEKPLAKAALVQEISRAKKVAENLSRSREEANV
jgi:hypothetical protein